MSQRLRIVRAMPFFAPAVQFGGTVAQADAVSAALARRGHAVSVLTSDLGQESDVPRAAWVERRGYRVYYSRCNSPLHRRPPYLGAATGDLLAEELRSADLLCLNVGLTLANARAARAAREHGVPWIYNAEGALCPTRLRVKRWRKAAFLRTVERRMLRDATALQAVTEVEAADLVRLGADRARIHHIPNGVESATAASAEAAARFRAAHGAGEPGTVLALFLGRIEPLKGIDLTLEAVAMLRNRQPDLRLQLVVAGPDEGIADDLRRRARALGISEQVAFSGVLRGADKAAALAAADLFALTSRTEGLPNAALEAAAAGLPLWLTTACNLPEVTEYGAGEVAPVQVDALADGLSRLAESEHYRRRCADGARRMVIERFALEVVVDALEELYRKLASAR